MEIYGILWDFFIIPGSLDFTEHVPQFSMEISHNFPNFVQNFVKFEFWSHQFEELTFRRRLEVSIPKKSVYSTRIDLSFAPSASKIRPCNPNKSDDKNDQKTSIQSNSSPTVALT